MSLHYIHDITCHYITLHYIITYSLTYIHTQKHRNIETKMMTKRPSHFHKGGRGEHTNIHTSAPTYYQAYIHTYIHTNIHPGRPAGRQTRRQTDKQAGRQTCLQVTHLGTCILTYLHSHIMLNHATSCYIPTY